MTDAAPEIAALHPADPPPLVCLICHMTDPPPEQTCTLGLNHRVGGARGCPACLRLIAACARRPCSANHPA
jgi:hypothetical protein